MLKWRVNMKILTWVCVTVGFTATLLGVRNSCGLSWLLESDHLFGLCRWLRAQLFSRRALWDIRAEIEVVALISSHILCCVRLIHGVTVASHFTYVLSPRSYLANLTCAFTWHRLRTLLTCFTRIIHILIDLTSFKAKTLRFFGLNTNKIGVQFRWLEFLILRLLSMVTTELLLRNVLLIWTLRLIVTHSSILVLRLLNVNLFAIVLGDDRWEECCSILLDWCRNPLHLFLCKSLIALPCLCISHGAGSGGAILLLITTLVLLYDLDWLLPYLCENVVFGLVCLITF